MAHRRSYPVIRHKTAPEPSGCRWCGFPERTHGLRFHVSRLEGWQPPTTAQRKARIIANIKRREATIVPKKRGPLMESARREREILDKLRRDISAARLRVSLDKRLGRETPEAVKKLASLPEPPQI